MVASAVRYPGKVTGIYVGATEWQRECYRHYTICGEARYAATYHGHALSRARLYVTESIAADAARLDSGPAYEALHSLFNGLEGQEQMLEAIGIHFTVAGECYLVGRMVTIEDMAEEVELWEVLAVTEVKKAGENWSITSKEQGEPDIPLPDDAVVIRLWRPHPARRLEADSPFRSLLPVLREIENLTLRIFAECTSRLAGAGLMFVSKDIDFPEPPKEFDGQKIEVANQAEGLLWTLAEAMVRSVEDPSRPEALMPVVATVDPEVWKDGGKVAELMHFWTDLDENALEMRQGAIRRFALGMNMPPEKLLGIGSNPGTGGGTSNGVSHWGAWQIDEDYIKLHVEPDLGLICNALVVGFLRPLTEGLEYIRADTAELRLKPDRSKEAMELYDRGLLKGEVVLRENRFSPEDMMGPEEQKRWLTIKVATGSATPEQVQAALRALGVDLGTLLAPSDTTREARPDPSLIEHPTRDMPEAANLLLHVCEPIVLTALSRVGNRLRQRGKGGVQPSGVNAYEVHTVIAANGATESVMADAFPHAAMCLNGVAPSEKVLPVLDAYVRTLIANQRPHERRLLAKALEGVK
jgi:hypothetical protein